MNKEIETIPTEIQEETQEEELSIRDLPGVGPATAEKLEESGFDTLIAIAVASPSSLAEASGVSDTVARK